MKKIMLQILVMLSVHQLMAGDVDSIAVYSNAMKKEIKCVVIKPTGYRKSGNRFPVVYLLHGYGGNQKQWISLAPQLKNKVDELQMLIVCPDGGIGSWYLDSPIDSSFRYETFVSRELVNYVDSKYKTRADKDHRAITGLSMGGHGGLYLAIKHPDIYANAGSTSGGVDIRPFPNNWDLKKRLGDTICCKENWEKNTVINLVDQLQNKQLKLIIDCGLQDFFLEVNRNLHNKLMELKIEHDYIERPGAHNGSYWNNSVDYQLLFFKKAFK
jgi:S-formylglutathione hydrolase FrmB